MARRTKNAVTTGTTGTKPGNLPVSSKKPRKPAKKRSQTGKKKTAAQLAAEKGKKSGRVTKKTRIEKFLEPLIVLFQTLEAARTEILIGQEIMKQFEAYSPKTVLTSARNEKCVLAELHEKQKLFLDEVIAKICERFGKTTDDVNFYLNAANLRYNFGEIVEDISGKCLRALGRLQKGNKLHKLPVNVDREKINKLLSEVKAGKHGGDYAGVAAAVDKLLGSKSTRGRKAGKKTEKKLTVAEIVSQVLAGKKLGVDRLPIGLRTALELIQDYNKDHTETDAERLVTVALFCQLLGVELDMLRLYLEKNNK